MYEQYLSIAIFIQIAQQTMYSSGYGVSLYLIEI